MLKQITVASCISLVLVGCGGGSGDGDGGYKVTGEPVTITSQEEAAVAMSSLSSMQSLNSPMNGLGGIANAPSRQAPSLASVNTTEQCSNGGSMSINANGSETSMSGTIRYNECSEYDMYMNGAMSISMSYTQSGSKDIYKLNMSTSNLTMNSSDFSASMSLSAKFEEWTDYSNYDSYMSSILSGTMNMSASNPTETINAGFENYQITMLNNAMTIDGKLSFDSTLHTCGNGVYEFETIETLTATNSSSGFNDGVIKINGTTFSFNGDGTADVTYADGTTDSSVTPSPCE